MERLQKVLARAGFGSRRSCEQLIVDGEVEVDGKIMNQLGVRVDTDRQAIRCRGRVVRKPEAVVYVFHKPAGVISSTKDERGRRTVMDYFRGLRDRVYPVGRLDKESTGLMLLTNDGELANRLTHPRYQIIRRYHVVLRGRLDETTRARIEKGVWLSDGKTGSAHIEVKKYLTQETVLEITIREGLNREIRRIFAKFGYKVRRLRRIQLGPIWLNRLSAGAYRALNREEIEALRGAALGGIADG